MLRFYCLSAASFNCVPESLLGWLVSGPGSRQRYQLPYCAVGGLEGGRMALLRIESVLCSVTVA